MGIIPTERICSAGFLSFGGKAELLEPKDIRDELLKIAESMVKVYQKAGETE